MMKKMVSLCLIVIILMGVSGCVSRENMTEKMISYMNEKYDEEFEYIGVTGGHLGSNTKQILVSSKSFPEREIGVGCSEVDGEEYYFDGYLAVKYEKQTRELLEKIVSEHLGKNYYLKYVPSYLGSTENGTKNTSFSEYVADETSAIFFVVGVERNVTDEKRTVMEETIKRAFDGMAVTGQILFVHQGADFSVKDGESVYMEYMENKKFSNFLFFSKTSTDFSMIRWTEGKDE